MKAELEHLNLKSKGSSVNFFKIETEKFKPYWHYHPEIELTFIDKGEGTRIVGNSIELFKSKDLVLVGENTPHNWVSSNSNYGEIQTAYVFQFDAKIFSDFIECLHFLELFNLSTRGIKFNQPSIEIIEDIKNFENLSSVDRVSSLMTILDSLCQQKNRDILINENYTMLAKNQYRIQKFSNLNKYILENLDKKLTVEIMADKANMVPQSFCRWFKHYSGFSFIKFLNKIRIENACQLLLHDHQSIRQIALACGFESLSHFNRTFKQYKKTNPSNFRKKLLTT